MTDQKPETADMDLEDRLEPDFGSPELSDPESTNAVIEADAFDEIPDDRRQSGQTIAPETYPVSDPGSFDHEASEERARPIPRISIQAFCEDSRTAQPIEAAAGDRRLSKAHVSINMGGIRAAIANYQDAPTPNLIVVESAADRDVMIAELDSLAEACDSGTKVIVVGHLNDVVLYRDLIRRGVSEYLVFPLQPLQLMETISGLYNDPESDPVGHVYAFVGSKGGVGSSTVCHNTAWAISECLKTDVVIADLDLPFGTAGLDFNQDPVQGIADALSSPERVDEVLLDRLLAKCTDHLSLFAAPGMLDRDYNISPEAYEWVIEVMRQSVPYLAVDMPHLWSKWARQLLLEADEIIITATPDLASLRNAKNLVDLLKEHRNNDRPPQLVLNQVGVPKRPEIPVKEFTDALSIPVNCVIDFDTETFGTAANNGQMIAEVSEKAKSAEQFRDLALKITHKAQTKQETRSVLAPLLEKIKRKKAGAR